LLCWFCGNSIAGSGRTFFAAMFCGDVRARFG